MSCPRKTTNDSPEQSVLASGFKRNTNRHWQQVSNAPRIFTWGNVANALTDWAIAAPWKQVDTFVMEMLYMTRQEPRLEKIKYYNNNITDIQSLYWYTYNFIKRKKDFKRQQEIPLELINLGAHHQMINIDLLLTGLFSTFPLFSPLSSRVEGKL